ncbi:ADP-ribosyl-[dinitrogen reductase] hydrolase [Desulfospira joergensenii]|uniref:ADP-ribosyl-[dinitrogen reductase] hydrolase n=1 Tax=Desulfospira joergensenii TaxID=53329 RepID=UPI0003B60683|nr:ADP-ribosyl-[dinitrogen reductase] hydrolase [Desulfospira joergensenii]
MHSIQIPDQKQIVDKAKAAFVGLAIGDALGATCEFMTPGEIKLRYGVHKQIIGKGWLFLKAGQVTDDTEMSICIGRAIRDSRGWNLRAVAEEFADWVRGRPVDVGSTCSRGIRNYLIHQTLEMPPSRWSAGNGALMRMLPVALYTLGNDELLTQYVVEQAHLTHNNPLSDAACIFFGRLLHEALTGAGLNQLQIHTDDFVEEHSDFNYHPYPGKSSAYVVDTVQTVFHFLFSTATFEECLIGTVNQGGDADTTGALAGMLAGAVHGIEGIPKRWLKRLDSRVYSEVEALSEYLVTHSPALVIKT